MKVKQLTWIEGLVRNAEHDLFKLPDKNDSDRVPRRKWPYRNRPECKAGRTLFYQKTVYRLVSELAFYLEAI